MINILKEVALLIEHVSLLLWALLFEMWSDFCKAALSRLAKLAAQLLLCAVAGCNDLHGTFAENAWYSCHFT